MADTLLARIEKEIAQTTANVVNVKLKADEVAHVGSVRDSLEEGFRYECELRNFDDWDKGSYKVLCVTLDGATRLVLPHADPTVQDGMIGQFDQ